MIDLSKVYKKYNGQWVAFKSDNKTVIASGKTAAEALNKAYKKGYDLPILERMPDELIKFIGASL